ncbi:hypothetical protein BGW80DRAFT_1247619 [Lactifluus volemus]|nr:hypothetical protein BGW80DRAFT_1247619 [Lactifluus volemus]
MTQELTHDAQPLEDNSDQQGYLKPLGFEGRVTVGPPDPRGTPDAIAGGDNRGVTEEMSEDTTGGGVLVGAQAYSEKQPKEQGEGGGENGCCDEVQWSAYGREARKTTGGWGREVRGTAGGWRWQEWMLWQGKVAHVAGKGPEKQGDEEVVEMDAFMRCSVACMQQEVNKRSKEEGRGRNERCDETQWCAGRIAEVHMQQEDNNRSKETGRGGNRCFN